MLLNLKDLTKQMHSDPQKRRSSYLVALLFWPGDLRRYELKGCRKMFGWFKFLKKKREKFPLYLGDLAVVPRTDIQRFLEFDWNGTETDLELKEWISDALSLPLHLDTNLPTGDYLVIDVMISEYRTGGSGTVGVGVGDIPLFWRPYVKLHVRLKQGSKKGVLGDFVIKKQMPWREYLGKVLSLRSILNWGGVFTDRDLKYLVLSGLLEGLQWAQLKAKA